MSLIKKQYVLKETLGRHGRIDALLNIAGAIPGLDLMEMTDEQWAKGTELKLHGARRITIHAWGALKKSRGAVVFISGTAALEPKSATAAVDQAGFIDEDGLEGDPP